MYIYLLNFIRKLTIKKLINYLLLRFSYYYSYFVKKPYILGKPVVVAIEPTNLCNLQCVECPTGTNGLTRVKGNMDLVLFHKIINELSHDLISMIFYFQGEPFLNKDIFKMIKKANEKNLYTYCSTNGHFFSNENIQKLIESKLNELIISLDGTTQEVYEQYRRKGSLKKVLSGTKALIQEKKRMKSVFPYTKFQFLVVKPNEHQIDEAKALAKFVKVDKIVFKTAQIYKFENGSPLIPDNKKYSRYKKQNNGKYRLKKKIKNRCWRLWSNPVITVEGDVLPCCFDKDAKYAMGNINNQSFEEIWNNENYQNFRKKVLINRKSIDICRNCTE
jgi:radical SAM protein with 4Fe4S-binding SPASM domain